MKNQLLPFFFFLFSLSVSVKAQEPEDSVVVVKGQVSDYTITLKKKKFRTGQVFGPDGKPLEGATVMYQYSPAHDNTDANGMYRLADYGDTIMVVYYPGMEMTPVTVKRSDNKVNFRLTPQKTASVKAEKARATEWFDPLNDHSTTFCNPVNISYNFEPYNNNVKANGSFRSSADPMLVNYKGEYFLFSTNQGGFHVSKDLSHWEFVYASFQRTPNRR